MACCFMSYPSLHKNIKIFNTAELFRKDNVLKIQQNWFMILTAIVCSFLKDNIYLYMLISIYSYSCQGDFVTYICYSQ